MANERNLIQNRSLTPSERRESASRAGKASGESRRRKAALRDNLNIMLTLEIDSPEWKPILEAMGLDCTVESAINGALVREAIAGDVNAYRILRDTVGQTTKSDEDLREQQAKTRAMELANEEKEKAMSGSGKSGIGDAIAAAYAKRKAEMEHAD